MGKIAVITTFANSHFPVHAKDMLESFVKYWPNDVELLVQADDDLLKTDIEKIIGPSVVCGWQKDHAAFVERNKGRDDQQNYRKQATRFCHKVFAIKHAADSIMAARKEHIDGVPRYLIWIDSDVIFTAPVTHEILEKCLPEEGDAVSYLGRMDWDHSECGWLAFDFENGGMDLINLMSDQYLDDRLFHYEQWHDSYLWDKCINEKFFGRATNLTKSKPGVDIWLQSPMASFSTHYKGPEAKLRLMEEKNLLPRQDRMQPLKIVCKNSIPDEEIHNQIKKNLLQIKNWIQMCKPSKEAIVVVSAGPMMVPEDLIDEQKKGRKIVAVKHALKKLLDANIRPWACILLDPREHVYDFVQDPPTDIIWFVASQVHPRVVKQLLDKGCQVWGYHAPVGAGESELFKEHEFATVPGGSASATRGLFLLEMLGFTRFRLYGYDLCVHKKPDMNEKDAFGQPKYLNINVGAKSGVINMEKSFWTEGQLAAQIDELSHLIDKEEWKIEAFGFGVLPFLCKTREVNKLREKAYKAKMSRHNPVTVDNLIRWKTIPSLINSRKLSHKIRRSRNKASN